jgi:hypothetical protein
MLYPIKVLDKIGGPALLALSGASAFSTGRDESGSEYVFFRLKNRPFAINAVKITASNPGFQTLEFYREAAGRLELLAFRLNVLDSDISTVFFAETGIEIRSGRLAV